MVHIEDFDVVATLDRQQKQIQVLRQIEIGNSGVRYIQIFQLRQNGHIYFVHQFRSLDRKYLQQRIMADIDRSQIAPANRSALQLRILRKIDRSIGTADLQLLQFRILRNIDCEQLHPVAAQHLQVGHPGYIDSFKFAQTNQRQRFQSRTLLDFQCLQI